MKIKNDIEEFDVKIDSEKIKQLIKSIKRLEVFPFMNKPLMNVIDMPTDYMYFVIEKNYVFYRMEKEIVKIIRIIDTRRNYINILFGE